MWFLNFGKSFEKTATFPTRRYLREDVMIYSGPTSLRSYDSAPSPSLPHHLPSVCITCIYFSVFLCVAGWAYSGRGKFMPLPLKSKILETPGFLVTDYIKMFPLWIQTLNLQASLMVQCELSRICNYSSTCPQSKQT